MKIQDRRLAPAFAFCLCLMAQPTLAQSGNLDANGMPRDRSTPAEQAETATLNRQINNANSKAQAQYDREQAEYQATQRQYQDALKKSEAAQKRYQDEKATYDKNAAAYEAQRAQYRAKRAAYRHHAWPAHYADAGLTNDASIMNAGVKLVNGDPVGKVIGLAHARDGKIEAVKIQLDGGPSVWIDSSDARMDHGDGTIVTDLYAEDLQKMAGGGAN